MRKILLSIALTISSTSLASAQSIGQLDLTNITAATQPGNAGGDLANWVQSFYLFSLVGGVFLAVGVIVWAGIRYSLAAGNPSTQSDARDQILQALLGLLLLFGAYLVLNTINPTLTNLAPPTLNSVSAPGVQVAPGGADTTVQGDLTTGGTTVGTGLTDAQARETITSAGIDVKTGQGAASLAGLQPSTVNGVVGLKQSCPSCHITITSGTDGVHSTKGIQSHANGYKVDLRPTDSLNSYITDPTSGNFTRMINRISDGAPQYRDKNGNIYAREKDHWDVLYH